MLSFALFLVSLTIIKLVRTITTNLSISASILVRPVRSAVVGIYNNQFVIINGYNYSHENQYEWRTQINTNSWTKTFLSWPDMASCDEVSLGRQLQFQIENVVYIVNGHFDATAYNYHAFLKYNLQTAQYLSTTTYNFSTPAYRYRSCVTHNHLSHNEFYILGGRASYYTANSERVNVYSYVIDADIWSTKADLNSARAAAGCAMDYNAQRLFIFGGSSGGQNLDTIEMLNISASVSPGLETWELLTAPVLVAALDELQCILFIADEKIYCFGGNDYSGYYYNSVQIFDPLSYNLDTSSYIMNYPRKRFGLVSDLNCIYIIGGNSVWGYDLNMIEQLCLDTSTSTTTSTSTVITTGTIITTSVTPTSAIMTSVIPTSAMPTSSSTLFLASSTASSTISTSMTTQNSKNKNNDDMDMLFVALCSIISLVVCCIIGFIGYGLYSIRKSKSDQIQIEMQMNHVKGGASRLVRVLSLSNRKSEKENEEAGDGNDEVQVQVPGSACAVVIPVQAESVAEVGVQKMNIFELEAQLELPADEKEAEDDEVQEEGRMTHMVNINMNVVQGEREDGGNDDYLFIKQTRN